MSMISDLITSIAGGLIAIVITFLVQRKRRITKEQERAETARKEVLADLLHGLAQDPDGITLDTVQALLNSKFRGLESHVQLDAELKMIMDDLVTILTENYFIPQDERRLLIERARAINREFHAKKPDLRELVAEWNELSTPRIILRVINTVVWSLIAGILTIVIMFRFVGITGKEFVQTLIIVFVAAAVFGCAISRNLRKSRRKSGWRLDKTLRESVADALVESFKRETVKQESIVKIGDRVYVVDFMLRSHDVIIPIEIHLKVSKRLIEQVVAYMGALKSARGLIISSEMVNDKLRRMGQRHGIKIIDNVSSKDDLVNRLKNARLLD